MIECLLSPHIGANIAVRFVVDGLAVERQDGSFHVLKPALFDQAHQELIDAVYNEYGMPVSIWERVGTTALLNRMAIQLLEGRFNNKPQYTNGYGDSPIRLSTAQEIPLDLQELEEYARRYATGEAPDPRLSPEEQRGFAAGGSLLTEAYLIARTGVVSDEETATKAETAATEAALTQWAKERGVWYEDIQEAFGDVDISDGAESKVWVRYPKVVKATANVFYPSWAGRIEAYGIHNTLFPATTNTFVGFGKDNEGKFRIITSQPFIEADLDSLFTQQDVVEFMESVGFKSTSYNGTEYENAAYSIYDLRLSNVFKTPGGNIAILDSIIEFNIYPESGGRRREVGTDGLPTLTVPSTYKSPC